MQPWLCRMLQQLCTFPPRSLLLIMFPLSVALQLNVLHASVSLRIGKSVVQASPLFFCRLKQNEKRNAWCRFGSSLKQMKTNMVHHDPSTKPFLSQKMRMFQSIVFFSRACFVVFHPCNHDSHFHLNYHWCLCSRCPDLFLSAHRLLSERQADY